MKPEEAVKADLLGLTAIKKEEQTIGFRQPCHLWNGKCSIYDHPSKPDVCGSYRCDLLKKLIAETVSLPEAMKLTGQAKQLIAELEPMLETPSSESFLKRLLDQAAQLGPAANSSASLEFRLKAGVILIFFKKHFSKREYKTPEELNDEETTP